MDDQLRGLTASDLVQRLADRTPTPGGGAAIGVVGAIAAGLAEMALAFSVGRGGDDDAERTLNDALQRTRQLRTTFLDLADADAAAYARLSDALGAPKTDPRRAANVAEAAAGAAGVPLDAMRAGVELLGSADAASPFLNRHLRADLLVAADLGLAVAHGAARMVRANLPLLGTEAATRLEAGASDALRRAEALRRGIAD